MTSQNLNEMVVMLLGDVVADVDDRVINGVLVLLVVALLVSLLCVSGVVLVVFVNAWHGCMGEFVGA